MTSMAEGSTKVLLVANTSWYLYNFRRPLARALRARGLEPVLLAPRDGYSERLIEEGFSWRELDLSRARVTPLRELRSLIGLIRVYRRERPAAVHHFTIRCVIYGTIAALVARVPVRINAVTGLGHVFLSRSLKTALLRPPLRLAYRFVLGVNGSRVIFQNPDDRQTFVDARLVAPAQTLLVRSSGVDINMFSPAPESNKPGAGPLTVLFASRLLREKGILELIEAIRILKAAPETSGLVFKIAGEAYPGNPSSVTDAQVRQWSREGLADFLGHVDPVLDLIAQSDIVVLPSYREGTPRILLEACAMEKPTIATDVPGCREIVEHGKNGLLVPPRDARALADAIARLARDPGLRRSMGKNGRDKVVAEFSDVEIARQTLQAYETLGVLTI
jgi:glycosyltransferase involved in cell wall biosynthesis